MTLVRRVLSGRWSLLLAAVAATSCGDDPAQTPATPATTDAAPMPTPTVTVPGPPLEYSVSSDARGWSLAWHDEFDGDRVDPKRWYVSSGYKGHGTISSAFSPDCVEVKDGVLRIFAKRTVGAEYPYATGRIDSFKRYGQRYGRVEVRARFPRAPGVWYAIWARPESGPLPELDLEVKETSGALRAWFVNHWDLPPVPADQRRSFFTVEDVDPTEFHVYGVTWLPGLVEWTIDGVPYMRSTTKGVPDSPIFWTLNGWTGGWGGNPAADLPLPVAFEVDYFRYYAAPFAGTQ